MRLLAVAMSWGESGWNEQCFPSAPPRVASETVPAVSRRIK